MSNCCLERSCYISYHLNVNSAGLKALRTSLPMDDDVKMFFLFFILQQFLKQESQKFCTKQAIKRNSFHTKHTPLC